MQKNTIIQTKLHVLCQNIMVDPDTLRSTGGTGSDSTPIQNMMVAPLYIATQEVLDLLELDSNHKSIQAILKSGRMYLPFPSVTVEFAVGVNRFFINLKETSLSPQYYTASTAFLDERTNIGVVHQSDFLIKIKEAEFEIALKTKDFSPNPEEAMFEKAMGHACITAVTIIVMMQQTRGIETVSIDCSKINKARAKTNKSKVPKHTVIRIGKIQTKSGKTISAAENQKRQMPIHVRAAHNREQRYGPGLSKTKIVFIKSVLVNFKEGDEAPVQKPRLLKA